MNHWSRERVIETLRAKSQTLGHSLSVREAGPLLYQVCWRYFGSFNNAKKAAGLTVNPPKHHVINKNAKELSQDLAYILGVINGDGHYGKVITPKRVSAEIGLNVRDLDFAEEFKNKLKKWSGIEPKFHERNGEVINFWS